MTACVGGPSAWTVARSTWSLAMSTSSPAMRLRCRSSRCHTRRGRTRDRDCGESNHASSLLRASRRSTSPSASESTSTTSRGRVGRPSPCTELAGTSSTDDRRPTRASFARPRSGGAATRTFQPSPCRPTSLVRAAPGETVTLIRVRGVPASLRRRRRSRPRPRRCAAPTASTPPRGPASRRCRGSCCRARRAPVSSTSWLRLERLVVDDLRPART